MIRDVVTDFKSRGVSFLHTWFSQRGGRAYCFEVRTTDRSEAVALASELVEAAKDVVPQHLSMEATSFTWIATRQSYRFIVRVWLGVGQLVLPGMEDLT